MTKSELSQKNYHTIFIAASDNYAGYDRHGLYQLFKYFQETLKLDCAYLCTQERKYDHVGSYDISAILPLYLVDPRKFDPSKGFKIEDHSLMLQQNLDCLPQHNVIILGDRHDMGPSLVAQMIEERGSKVIYYSMLNDIVTGICAYPAEYECENYKNGLNCVNCPKAHDELTRGAAPGPFPAVPAHNHYMAFQHFFKRFAENITICSASTYTHELIKSTPHMANVRKMLIPLKVEKYDLTVDPASERKAILESISEQCKRPIKRLCVWGAMNLDVPRKGLQFFLQALSRLNTHYMADSKFRKYLSETVFVVAGDSEQDYTQFLGPRYPYVVLFTGAVSPIVFGNWLAVADFYCCTTLADAGPRTVTEAFMMGCPVVSYDRCIAADLVDEQTGVLVPTKDVDALALGIKKLLMMSEDQRTTYAENCLDKYAEFYDDGKLKEAWIEALGLASLRQRRNL